MPDPCSRPMAAPSSSARGVPAGLRRARPPSLTSIAMPITENVAPPRSMKWVGDHSVTSWPKIRCQTSSRGSAARPNAEQKIISAPPTGIRQLPPRRTQAGPGSWPWREPEAQHAGGERAEEAEQHRPVAGVAERPVVAPVVDVVADVPEAAAHHRQQRDDPDEGRQRRPRRQPEDERGRRAGAREQARAPAPVRLDQPQQRRAAAAVEQRSSPRAGPAAPRRRMRPRRRSRGWRCRTTTFLRCCSFDTVALSGGERHQDHQAQVRPAAAPGGAQGAAARHRPGDHRPRRATRRSRSTRSPAAPG